MSAIRFGTEPRDQRSRLGRVANGGILRVLKKGRRPAWKRTPAEARRAVYDKARNALIGQLKAVDPPLTTAEISRQRLELEEAIRKVERENRPPRC